MACCKKVPALVVAVFDAATAVLISSTAVKGLDAAVRAEAITELYCEVTVIDEFSSGPHTNLELDCASQVLWVSRVTYTTNVTCTMNLMFFVSESPTSLYTC